MNNDATTLSRRSAVSVAPLFMVLLLALPSGALFSQSAGGADQGATTPSVALPDMEAEVRDLAPKGVDAPPPPEEDLPLPQDLPPLPREGELAIPASAYATEATLDTAARPALGETFTEAWVGAGIMNSVSASLSIYRPETNPSFGMTFSHDALDGIAFNGAGEGYYRDNTSLSGRVKGGGDGAPAWSLSGAYSDEGVGFQGQSQDYYGVSLRFFDLSGDYRVPLANGLSVKALMAASSADRTLDVTSSGSGTDTITELRLDPQAALEWSGDSARLSFTGAYGFRGVLNDASFSAHRVVATLDGSLDLSPSLSLGAQAAVASSTSFPLLFPFSLSAQAALGEAASFSLSGGLASDPANLAGLWKDNPYMDAAEAPPDDARWFADGKFDFFLLPGLSARAGAAFATSLPGGGRISSVAPSDSRGLYSYTYEEYTTLGSSLGLRYLKGGALLSVSWDADWLDPPDLDEPQRIKADLEYRDREEHYGGAVAASMGFSSSGFDLPIVDASGFVRLGGGVRFVAEIRDLLTAFSADSGRVRYAPYLEDGFRADARLQLSL